MRRIAALSLVVLAACAVQPSAQAQAPATDPYGNYRGTWQGSFLFTPAETVGQPPSTARSQDGTLEIAADGTVLARFASGGCALAGTAAAYVSAANATLDVALSGCRDTRFNGRYAGRLINNPVLKYASLRLGRSTEGLTEGAAQVTAIVRR